MEAAARIRRRLEDGDFLVAVSAQRIDFGKQVARLAGSHIADEKSQKSAASQCRILKRCLTYFGTASRLTCRYCLACSIAVRPSGFRIFGSAPALSSARSEAVSPKSMVAA